MEIEPFSSISTNKHHLATIIITIDSGKNYQWMLKLVDESLRRSKIFTELQEEVVIF